MPEIRTLASLTAKRDEIESGEGLGCWGPRLGEVGGRD